MHSPIITPAQMRAAEEAAFARGVLAEALMDEAGAGIARSLTKFFPQPGKCIVFAGKGHNAGDAFVAARWLAQAGWEIETRLVFPEKELSALTSTKLIELREAQSGRGLCAPIREDAAAIGAQSPLPHSILLDGLLGLGVHPPLREPIRSACRALNSLRAGAHVVAVDLPSGLDGDTGEADDDCVIADFTITVGCAKRGLVADCATNFVGRLELVQLPELQPSEPAAAELATPEALRDLLPRRRYSAYKNQFGRIGIVAGSRGFTGAALLCSWGALRAGAGLVELFVPEEIYEIIASSAAPEVMVKPVNSYADLLDEPIDVWAIGPGLGKARAAEVLALIRDARQPAVIDADGLNIVAPQMEALKNCQGPRLLTPHPGEMKRIFPGVEKLSRAETARKFCEQYAVTLLLKGSRTIVAEADRPLSYNTTGNPGMATGGMGDVLTGVCAGLLGQKLPPHDAARLGAWLCGRAAELAIFNGAASEESLLPSDLVAHLGAAFGELRHLR
ncbi:MAG: NAD(P)H-hydrate dehydratase [Chthoniobacterales bacterium]